MRSVFRAATLAATAAFVLSSLVVRADETTQGYRYLMHSASPPVNAFDDAPDTFDRVSSRTVWQAPERTLIWSRDDQVGQPEVAGFALGQRRMGLLVPWFDPARSSAEETGWDDYGKAITYEAFDVSVHPGDEDRTIAGAPATHYRVEADLVRRKEGASADVHIALSTDVWVHEDKPFSWAPFATAGMFAEPRMQVALYEKLSKLGMVVRAESEFERHARDETGNVLGHPHESTRVTWVTDLETAPVPVVDVPLATDATLAELRKASRADAEGACRTVAAGGTPQFVERLLNESQQAAFLPELEKMCQRRAARQSSGG
ncbi:MAG: hypothetical protein ACODAC_05180 [Pseudomonadota bacterium]